MNMKIYLILIFQIMLTLSEDANFNKVLDIFKPSATIRLARPLKTGDVIKVKGTFADSGTEASFDLENDYCNWINKTLTNCIDYDLLIQFQLGTMKRRINVNGEWKHNIDTYNLRLEKSKIFKYKLKVKSDHFETELFDEEMAPLKFIEPIENLSIFRVYGHANIDSFKIKHEKDEDKDE